MRIANSIMYLLVFVLLLGCEKEEEPKNTLTVSKEKIEFPEDGGTASFTIETDAAAWELNNPASDWLTIPITSGKQKEALISLKVESKTVEPRIDTLTITAGNADPVEVIVAQATSEYLYVLKTNRVSIGYNFTSGSVSMNITSDAPQWNLTSDAEWITFSQESGSAGEITVHISTESNTETSERNAVVILSGEGAPTTEIPVTQKGTYPSYNTSPIAPDAAGMSSTAAELADQITIGWNIGNTLEAIGGETNWGNPKVTESLIQMIKANGFNAIRIPCSWNQYLENSTTAEIKTEWLDRVKEVVQYCMDNDMYTILNIHWDGGWLENNVTPARKEENNAKQKAFWEQIATHLRDFDEKLMFASANEPHADNATQMAVLQSYHQTFVDAVRATGGRNAHRVLVVQGPSTDIEKTNNLMSSLPNDNVPNKMMAEVHFYTPYQFCLMTEDANWGNRFFYWGQGNHSATDTDHNPDWGEESTIDNLMGLMKTKFVDQGIPVVLGEYGAIRRTHLSGDDLQLHLDSRAYYLEYVTRAAKENGLLPFYWDEGGTNNHTFGIFNRHGNTVFDQQALDALIDGATQ